MKVKKPPLAHGYTYLLSLWSLLFHISKDVHYRFYMHIWVLTIMINFILLSILILNFMILTVFWLEWDLISHTVYMEWYSEFSVIEFAIPKKRHEFCQEFLFFGVWPRYFKDLLILMKFLLLWGQCKEHYKVW